eukprot:scaffold112_cov196-Amphora_coffeaeformis.AAC.8
MAAVAAVDNPNEEWLDLWIASLKSFVNQQQQQETDRYGIRVCIGGKKLFCRDEILLGLHFGPEAIEGGMERFCHDVITTRRWRCMVDPNTITRNPYNCIPCRKEIKVSIFVLTHPTNETSSRRLPD